LQQQEDEKAYSATPFEPYSNAPEPGPVMASVAVADPLYTKGEGIFAERGCSACHGDNGTGTALAPSLVGITRKLPQDRLIALLHNPNARMKAGGMPAVDVTSDEMKALLAYLGSLGPHAQNSSTTLSSSQQLPSEESIDDKRQSDDKDATSKKQDGLTASVRQAPLP
jgi:mono/diheme cytochrome c family protein